MDGFIKIKDIDGESTDSQHVGWIEVQSYQFGVTNATAPASAVGGGTTQRAEFESIRITKSLDKSSPKLMLFCASGKHVESVNIEFSIVTGETRVKVFEVKLTDVVMSAFERGGNRGSGLPTESFALAYGTLMEIYYPRNNTTGAPAGSVPAGWDVAKNKPL